MRRCYLCLSLPRLFSLRLLPLPCSPPPLTVFHQRVQPLLTSCALPLIGKWWWDSKTTAETLHKRKGGRRECRRAAVVRETTSEREPSVFFVHFYHIYVHPWGSTMSLSGPLPPLLSLSLLSSFRGVFSPSHPFPSSLHRKLLNLASAPSTVSLLLYLRPFLSALQPFCLVPLSGLLI